MVIYHIVYLSSTLLSEYSSLYYFIELKLISYLIHFERMYIYFVNRLKTKDLTISVMSVI